MFLMKYCHFIVFFIANAALGDNNSTGEGRGWPIDQLIGIVKPFFPETNVETQYYSTCANCNQDFCKIDASTSWFNSNDKCSKKLKKNTHWKVLVHGFTRDHTDKWIGRMKNQLVKQPNTNVIAINWEINKCLGPLNPFKNTPIYRCAFDNIDRVAEQSAYFLAQEILKSKIVKVDNLHILGHSMGAHIAGLIGEKLKKQGLTVDRITGLDPAMPRFESSEYSSLKKSHANFVDVIHTNSRPQDDSAFGLYKSHGHVDIYPNGGDNQPGCPLSTTDAKLPEISGRPFQNWATDTMIGKSYTNLSNNLVNRPRYLFCNHYYAPEYMSLSLLNKSCKYLAIPMKAKKELKNKSVNDICKIHACVQMGINATKIPGNYYIDMKRLDEHCKPNEDPTDLYEHALNIVLKTLDKLL